MTRLLEDVLTTVRRSIRRGLRLSDSDSAIYRDLRAATAFDVTDVADATGGLSWAELRRTEIPKTPPFDLTWAEWTHREEKTERGPAMTRRVGGLFVVDRSGSAARSILDHVDTKVTDADSLAAAPAVVSLMFSRGERGLGFHALQTIFFLRPPCESNVRSLTFLPDCIERRLKDPPGYIGFGLGLAISIDLPHEGEPHEYGLTCPWPALHAFSLLHCRNVVVEAEPRKPRVVLDKIRPHRVPVEYRVLRVEVPVTRRRTPDRDEPSRAGSQTRLHVCRGHFKNLQHDRFTRKGWHWWPAHWRGDPAVGLIEKEYKVSGVDDA